jgi:hypothetical protein
VPPYGFNYQYLNAIDSDLAEKAAIDPATQIALAQARRLNCGAVGGGYLLYGGGGYVVPEQTEEQSEGEQTGEEPAAQPQVIVVQVPVAAQAAATKPVAAAEEEPPALPDLPAFVLVMRDGTQVKATAFTRSANAIVYITPEGERRTALLSDVDTDATVRLNGERGAQLQLSL